MVFQFHSRAQERGTRAADVPWADILVNGQTRFGEKNENAVGNDRAVFSAPVSATSPENTIPRGREHRQKRFKELLGAGGERGGKWVLDKKGLLVTGPPRFAMRTIHRC